MRIDPAGFPFIVGALAPAVGLVLARRTGWAVPFAAAAGFFTYFFRDPDRVSPDDPDGVLAPADGRVFVAGAAQPEAGLPGEWQQVSVFLSPVDVHVNRSPVSGVVTRVAYHPGCFLPAYKPESCQNEHSEVWVDHEGQLIVFRQVVGVLARRVVCRLTAGMQLRAGDRVGLMKFGSRMDVFLPLSATLLVKAGDYVRGGESVIARLGASTSADSNPGSGVPEGHDDGAAQS